VLEKQVELGQNVLKKNVIVMVNVIAIVNVIVNKVWLNEV
jgi:hypothetical protein